MPPNKMYKNVIAQLVDDWSMSMARHTSYNVGSLLKISGAERKKQVREDKANIQKETPKK